MTSNGQTNIPPLAQTQSISGTPIRITHQQWAHITENHDYMAGCLDMVIETVSDPDLIANGWTDEKVALRHYPKTPITEKNAVVVYKETSPEDGFVITAFLTSKPHKITQRGIQWQRPQS
ncbi:hypothetical protein H6G52_12680 [Limnothrix sp. FACHB-881]|uniref:PBECR2 nuclease fold domain-containing protein n=1 Tax=Limnothrix redekei LRLZ20PSL1 TaxID=3112953 RepID=A0ABW7C646_9CYAN|nr:PBECR2 nuclease fold domain-containing protein [Limnothrix sp. FACHB-881]MBD2636219.1 hypothetical protein [Limnothrix sp. FACHB-881]